MSEADRATFFGGTAQGYIDYPTLVAATSGEAMSTSNEARRDHISRLAMLARKSGQNNRKRGKDAGMPSVLVVLTSDNG